MIARAPLPLLLALCLVLSGLTSVVAQTRMAAAGGYCGIDAPQLLLDAAGLPLLDTQGDALQAPDCLACHLTTALLAAVQSPPGASFLLIGAADPTHRPPLSAQKISLGGQARAPPSVA